jgi:hypothetical protein
VSALKEQLATANQSLQLVEGKGGGCNKPSGGDMEHNAMDIISRSGFEVELAAKEKEVSRNLLVKILKNSICIFGIHHNGIPLTCQCAPNLVIGSYTLIFVYTYIRMLLSIRSQIEYFWGTDDYG